MRTPPKRRLQIYMQFTNIKMQNSKQKAVYMCKSKMGFSRNTHTYTHRECVKFEGVKHTYMQVLAFDAIFHEIPSLQH